ncbi:acyltransferase domain-containing protein [Glycomyces sp. L485]|uniref:acyltransferase domain-containing protein n=1 Tax=Glycomyces sp. L485 TaxID=2909235 RepID=UPI001F4B09AD|nr:acyltransferase domain-containing protein [Glycomyces sp. L485]MCH7232476.1 acyltransferase domain-containing protein [Glycomyces sp. L485]
MPPIDAAEVSELLLDWCGADREDADAAAAAVTDLDGDLMEAADRRYQSIAADMGGRLWLRWPKPPADRGAAGRLLGLYPVLAAVPLMLELHRERGVDEALSRLVLADVGEKLRLNRRLHGRAALDVAFWFTAHVRGTIYQLGRLQFCMEGTTAMPRMGLHIRGEGGPLSPEAVRDSVERALAFFPATFPELFPPERSMTFMCSSWLLDPQLRDWLPEGSNILKFGELFDLVRPASYANAGGRDDIWRFVFAAAPDVLVERLPTDNTLQRSVKAGLEAGVGFQTRLGGLNRKRLGL